MGKVLIHGYDRPIIREKAATASQTILEGMLLAKASGANTWSKHSTAGGTAEPIFALEDKAGNVDRAVTAYPDGANIAAIIRPPMVSAWLQDGEVVVEGDALESNGDGTLRKAVLTGGAGSEVALIGGGSAGNHTVTGIATADRLIAVLHVSTAASIATAAELTSEFSISAANTIENAGGTDTSSDQLWVYWETAEGIGKVSIIGHADEAKSPSGADVRIKVRVA